MSSTLGKRKRVEFPTPISNLRSSRSTSPSSSSGSEASVDLQDIFRRAFEAKYQPLKSHLSRKAELDHVTLEELTSVSESDDAGWEGIGDVEEVEQEPRVEVVEHTTIHKPARLTKADARAYMSSKPPPRETNTAPKHGKAHQAPTSEAEDKTDKLNLKNDLALQRLISESHLLDPSKPTSSTGGQRQKILDMRLKSLGSKTSILEQEKMPMSHRKGIVAKAKDREARRRQEAKENGIVLEKAVKVKKTEAKRVRGVTGPAVGKFKGGTLRLGKRDVAAITGPKRFKRR